MKRFIFMERNGIHIMIPADARSSRGGGAFVRDLARRRTDPVGTTGPESIAEEAKREHALRQPALAAGSYELRHDPRASSASTTCRAQGAR
jgi:hypothetical protein